MSSARSPAITLAGERSRVDEAPCSLERGAFYTSYAIYLASAGGVISARGALGKTCFQAHLCAPMIIEGRAILPYAFSSIAWTAFSYKQFVLGNSRQSQNRALKNPGSLPGVLFTVFLRTAQKRPAPAGYAYIRRRIPAPWQKQAPLPFAKCFWHF